MPQCIHVGSNGEQCAAQQVQNSYCYFHEELIHRLKKGICVTSSCRVFICNNPANPGHKNCGECYVKWCQSGLPTQRRAFSRHVGARERSPSPRSRRTSSRRSRSPHRRRSRSPSGRRKSHESSPVRTRYPSPRRDRETDEMVSSFTRSVPSKPLDDQIRELEEHLMSVQEELASLRARRDQQKHTPENFWTEMDLILQNNT